MAGSCGSSTPRRSSRPSTRCRERAARFRCPARSWRTAWSSSVPGTRSRAGRQEATCCSPSASTDSPMAGLPPFRAEHVGSLLRPASLMAARDRHAQGRLTADELRQAEDEAIRQVVTMQEDIGLQGITDGEFRRGSWHMDFMYQIGGVTRVEEHHKIRFENESGGVEFTPAALRVVDRLRLDHTIFQDHFLFLKSITSRTPKLTIPAPSIINYRGGRAAIDPSVYPDLDEFWD